MVPEEPVKCRANSFYRITCSNVLSQRNIPRHCNFQDQTNLSVEVNDSQLVLTTINSGI